MLHCGICDLASQVKSILKWQGWQGSWSWPFKSWLAQAARCESKDNVKSPSRILSNFIFTNALHLVSSSYCHPMEWVLESRRLGRNENVKDLESEEGFNTNYNFSGLQLSAHLGSTNWCKVSMPLLCSFEYFFNDGIFTLSMFTSEFWK